MGTVRTHQFWNGPLPTIAPTVVFTVPAGFRAVVKWASLNQFSAGATSLAMWWEKPAGDVGFVLLDVARPSGLLLAVGELYAVGNEGDELRAQTGDATFTVGAAGGVLFEL